MTASVRFATSSWLPGAVLFGDAGFGVPGSTVPSSGVHGPAYTFPLLTSPADDNVEICGRLGALPSGLTLVAYENTSFYASGPDGTYHVPFTLYRDGVADATSYEFIIVIGGSGATITPDAGPLTITGYAPTVDISLSPPVIPGVGALTITGYAPTVTNTSPVVPAPSLGGGSGKDQQQRIRDRARIERQRMQEEQETIDTIMALFALGVFE